MSTIDGKVVMITGGTGAAGPAVTDVFVAAGWKIALVWNRTRPGDHPAIFPVHADVSRTDEMTRAVTEILGRLSRIDVLVNLVGGYAGGAAKDTSDDVWNRMLTVNLTCAFVATRAVLPHMIAKREGRILHVGSRASVQPFGGAVAYVVSKTGLAAFVRAAALELEGSGVTINAVLPGTIDTPENRRDNPGADTSRWLPPRLLGETLLHLGGTGLEKINGALIPVG
jgi:NAD(P)-dependent dehydrogenase (short-subunit alcohol dehydrogenase family)